MAAMKNRTSSFSRNLSGSTLAQSPGLKNGSNGALFVSSGIADLDRILGGGFPLGSLVMVMEDAEAPHHLLLLRNFMSQGLVHNQPLLYASSSRDPRAFLGTLPSPVFSKSEKGLDRETEQEKDLRIAWQYKKYFGENHQNLDNRRDSKQEYCNDFDLRKPIERQLLVRQHIDCVSIQDSPDLRDLRDRCSTFLAQFPRNSGRAACAGRIAIQSFCAPQCLYSNLEWEMLSFIRYLKSMIQSSNAVAVLTFPSSLLSPSFSKRWQHLADTLLFVRAIPDEDKELDKLLTGYQDMIGLLHVHKVAQINTQMDSIKPRRGRLARTFSKVLHVRAVTEIVPDDHEIRKIKSKVRDGSISVHQSDQSLVDDDEKLRNRAAVEILLAKLFASISSVKAAYAELQNAQSPYDAEGIQLADEAMVKELKYLSELKQCYLKKEFDPSPQVVQLLLAEFQEQQALLKTYEIMKKKLESQLKVKDFDATFLREKLEESEKLNRALEKRSNPSGSASLLDNLHLSGLNPNHFVTALRQTVKSIRSFVKTMTTEMESAGWDLDVAASSIEPGVVYAKKNHKCFAFESFVCHEMFDGFHQPKFSLPNESIPERKQRQKHFFERFTELISVKPKDYLDQKPRSTFGKFCRVKYLRLVHPKMESSFFGDLNQRSLVNSGGYPETAFFATFAEMARRVWLLHCLAFSFEPEASIFQVKKRCRFSEVYMKSVTEEVLLIPSKNNDVTPDGDSQVAFTVAPGFKIGETVIPCEVYLSRVTVAVDV